ncbi:MAG: hypothetical protein AAGD96_14545 [Chloroflexota bacterium]
MNLKLAIVATCYDLGCDVRLCTNDSELFAHYSLLVKDRIHIQPEQLVVIDLDTNPPEILWRWLKGVVLELSEDLIKVDDRQNHPAVVTLASELHLNLEVGDEVWMCSTGAGYEIHGLPEEMEPEHLTTLLNHITPLIKRIYQSSAE